jgi:hypothetical protein
MTQFRGFLAQIQQFEKKHECGPLAALKKLRHVVCGGS